MGRPEPCVMFAQTFVHPQLDEYVDEVIFAEPIVITACEFLEQNASSASPAVTLVGATSPPSFALEVFVQCEGETRFRRLCQPFLYSHSSSNVLEVDAVVTTHLVVRGSYRSLSLVIYGNTAEDLGQFNIEVDLDSSLTNTVSAIEGDLEDLPPALHPISLTIEESISPLRALCLDIVASDISIEIKQFLLLILKILELPDLGNAINTFVSSVVSAASAYATHSLLWKAISPKQFAEGGLKYCEESHFVLTKARKEILDIYKRLQHESGNLSPDILAESMFLESEADFATSKQLVDILSKHFHFISNSENVGHPQLSQNKNVILWLSVALLLCSGRESCFQFVNGGGMEQLGHVFCHGMQNSTAIMLMLLGVIEQATQHSIGCEGFLGWWPREDENIPSGSSEGYNQLLKFLLQKQCHDVASLATYILHRLRFYEVASRYECAVLSLLGSLSAVGMVTSVTLDMLSSAKLQLRKILKLTNSRGPIEDPSPVAHACRSLILGESGLLSYKATSSLITLSNCCFSNWDIDSHLLSLLKERGFLPLSAALLASSSLRSEAGEAMDLFVDIVSYIEAIILSLLSCRTGLIFLQLDSELSTTVVRALSGADDLNKEESIPIRYASLLISKGYFCHPRDVGMIVETHLRVVNAIDRLITSTPHSEEILWVLWELCVLSRSHCGRQSLLALGYFPEAVSVLLAALHSVKELDPVSLNTGASPLSLAIFHSAAEIFEVIVTDSTASSLASWIEHAGELHRALHSSSPGSNRKDAPTRLLEWIDAGVVYHRNGAIGLLRYAAVLASGRDAHVASTSILSSDVMDVENVVGDSSGSSDGNVIETLVGKPITVNEFSGVTLRDCSVVQLTTAFRIFAFISDNPAVATALYDEGAVMVVHAVLMDCRLMLERSSNNYDYLVDEGTECNSTSDLLLERNREQSIVDLLIPSLVLLINMLQRLQETKEQHRNTKLMNSLLQLHRELSPRLAACVADLSYPYPDFALGFEAVCHLLVSALACWPLYGWMPSLFHFLLDSLHATSLLALGPKETCSLLCLLNDLFPEEGVWLWKDGVPMLSALRTLAVGTLLGPRKERQINWYLQPGKPEKLLGQLTQQLDKIGHIILHCAISTLVVIQDMLRVFIIRVACLNADNASTLLQPIILWICDHLSEPSSLSETEAYKVYKLLDFLAILLEHPCAKPLLLKEGVVQMFTKVLERCLGASNSDENQFLESGNAATYGFSQLSWCVPVFRSISLIIDSRTLARHPVMHDRHDSGNLTAEDCSLFLSYLLRLCKVLPVGRELLASLLAFKELGSCTEGRSALLSIFSHIHSSKIEECESESRHKSDGNGNLVYASEWSRHPPLLCCWITLLRSIDSKDVPPVYVIRAVGALSSGALHFCMDGERLNLDRTVAVKYLFGLPCDMSGTDGFSQENTKYIQDLTSLLGKIRSDEYSAASDMNTTLDLAKESVKSLSILLQKPPDSVKADEIISGIVPFSSIEIPFSSKIRKITDTSFERVENYSLGGFGDKFLWECPENLRDRLSQTTIPLKRKMSSLEGVNRRPRGDNIPAEIMVQSSFSRGSGPPTVPPGPTRRDTFRQRKPNTSRPPSMHVDDYIARERNVDGTSSSNVIAISRVGSTGGRPPSIHVDEFMARQRERQNPGGVAVSNAATEAKTVPLENATGSEKLSKSKPLKPDIDDDLQGIDIVFDGEESESDDKLPFPQMDDILQQPATVIVEQNSPHSIVEETGSDMNGSIQSSHVGAASNVDENTQSEFSSRMSVSRPEMPSIREPSISSDKKYCEQSDETKNVPVRTSSGFDSAATASSSRIPASVYNKAPVVSRTPPSNFYPKRSQPQTGITHMAIGSQGFYDPKSQLNQPPLPPMPPPTISAVPSQTRDYVPSQSSPFMNTLVDLQPPLPMGFYVQTEYQSVLSNNSTSLASSSPLPDSNYVRTSLSSPGGSARPLPPLPPTPPPYSTNPSALPSLKTPTSQASAYSQTSIGTAELLQSSVASLSDARFSSLSASGAILTTYPPPPLMPPLLFSRPTSLHVSLYGSNPNPHQGENSSSISQNLPIPLPSIHSMHSLAQLQPLQPPQLPRPPQPPQHRPPIPASPQSEQGVSLLQSPVQMQVQQLQMLQQPQISPVHVYYPTQPENFSHTSPQQQVEPSQQQIVPDGTPQQQPDSGMSLQDYFSSPEAIQALLSDRDKLCQLLEQHPKLMQMLQERLGQL